MLFKDITLVDDKWDVKKHMYVGVKGDTIAYISDKAPTEDFGEVYDGNDRLLLPAFYNAHSHLPMMLMRGYSENLSLMDWLTGRIFPFEAKLTSDDIYYGCLAGIAEMLRYGIAATSEMYINMEPECRAFAESGAKVNLSLACTHMGPESYDELSVCRDTLDAIRDYEGYDNGRMHIEFCLHAEYTNTEKIARTLAEKAAEYGSSMHVHVAETKGEVEACRERHGGKSPVRFLADCGIFDVPTVAAHCVHIDEEDIAILKEHKVTVATCPKSNAKLASGVCSESSLLKAGVNIVLGTDSVASNNNLNMIEEMRFMNLFQKATDFDPTFITPTESLYIATRAGAHAQRRSDCGLIRVGCKADLTVLDIDKVYWKPCYNVLNNLIFSADGSDVVLTMADGRVLYRDGDYPTLDMERINYECERSRLRIFNELN